jgi:hypothetical protein
MPSYSVILDTDGQKIDLPEVVDVPSDIDPEDIADYLSDEYGWLVESLTELTTKSIASINL